jgi:cob(I)alamin adenosyltransferase
MSIYTRTGDDGTTSLFGGKRVLKCEELVDVYGSLDELNSYVGLIIAKFNNREKINFLVDIQKDLFTIGSYIAGWKGDLTHLNKKVQDMENKIDEMDRELPVLKNFILPGGSELSSIIHISRAITRKVERQYIKYVKFKHITISKNQISKTENQKIIIKYLNRLSDLLFEFARYINEQENQPEIVWKAG